MCQAWQGVINFTKHTTVTWLSNLNLLICVLSSKAIYPLVSTSYGDHNDINFSEIRQIPTDLVVKIPWALAKLPKYRPCIYAGPGNISEMSKTLM